MDTNIVTSNKKELIKYLFNIGWKITRVMAWSLSSFPRESITSDTKVLLPDLKSSHFLERAAMCNYDPTNISISYNMCNAVNIRIFEEKITESLIFYANGRCVVSKYLDGECGDFSPCKILDQSNKVSDKEQFFQETWDKSKMF